MPKTLLNVILRAVSKFSPSLKICLNYFSLEKAGSPQSISAIMWFSSDLRSFFSRAWKIKIDFSKIFGFNEPTILLANAISSEGSWI